MKLEFSAGGVVFQKNGDNMLVLVSQHSQHHGWVFPKGFIGDKIDGETKEDTAIREVKEETGIDAQILEKLTPITYWYVMDGQKCKKTVYYYVMKHLGGDTEDRDHEMEAVEWIAPEQVMGRLTYQSDKDVFEEALPIIERIANS